MVSAVFGTPRIDFSEFRPTVARMAAIVTCSAAGLSPTDLCARLRRPSRLMVAYALDPVEQIPAVEVVPGPLTDPACLDAVRNWLRRLGRNF